MDAHEALFLELEECRRKAPADAHCARPVSPQLDPVRVFAHLHPTLPPPFNPLLLQFTRCLTLFGCSGLPYGESCSNRCRLPSFVSWKRI